MPIARYTRYLRYAATLPRCAEAMISARYGAALYGVAVVSLSPHRHADYYATLITFTHAAFAAVFRCHAAVAISIFRFRLRRRLLTFDTTLVSPCLYAIATCFIAEGYAAAADAEVSYYDMPRCYLHAHARQERATPHMLLIC